MRGLKILAPVMLAMFWTYACVCVRFAPEEPPKVWRVISNPESDFEDILDLKKGPYTVLFEDWLNPLTKTPVVHYELINQWGQVIAIISINNRHRYVVRGIPRGCYILRAVGPREPSGPSNEACTPGLQTGRIWT